MNKFFSLLLVPLALYVGYRIYNKNKNIVLPKYSYLSCQGNSLDLRAKLQSSVYVVTKALPSAEEDLQSIYFGAAYLQNLYTFTNVMEINPHHPLKWVNLSSNPEIKIIRVEDSLYPTQVELDAGLEVIGFPQAQKTYLEKLLTLGKIERGEAAKKITYQYGNDFHICLSANQLKSPKNLKFIQPIDSFLAYFFVPKSERREIKKNKKISKLINPCLNPAGIGPNGDVSPFAFWYHWNPEIQGTDANKQSFDCQSYYQEDKNVQIVDVSLIENIPKKIEDLKFKNFEQLNRPILASIHIGASDNFNFRPMDKDKTLRYIKHYLSPLGIQEARDSLPKVEEQYDYLFPKILIMLWNFSKHIELRSQEIKIEKYHLLVKLKGKLKLSKKDLELNIYFSRNDPLVEGSDFFHESFSKDLVSSDILIYDGHASYGGIFSKIVKKEGNQSLDYQILALLSCSSGLYFNSSMFPKVSNHDFHRDIIQTGGGFMDFTGNSSIALIGSLDSYLYNESYVPFAYWAKAFKTDNFYILSND